MLFNSLLVWITCPLLYGWLMYGNVMGSGSFIILLYRHAPLSDVQRNELFICGRMWNISAAKTRLRKPIIWGWFIPMISLLNMAKFAARLWLWQGTFSSVADFVLFANLQLNILVLQRTFLSLLALQLLDNLADYVYVIASWCLILEDDFDLVDIGMNDMQILMQYFLHKALPHGFEFWHVLTVTRVKKQSNTW